MLSEAVIRPVAARYFGGAMSQQAAKPPSGALPDHPEGLAQSLEELAAAFNSARKDAESDESTKGSNAPRDGVYPNLEMVMRIPVTVQVVLGSANMPVANLVKLGRGAVVPLDRRVGEPVDLMVNGRVVARGEVVVVDEDSSRFGISLTEVLGPTSNFDKPS
jgi:flagellar motor switch protein FliN/FliY